MSGFEALNEMDPAVRAAAEVRAREAGMSVIEWLSALVSEQVGLAAPAHRPTLPAGGTSLARTDPSLTPPRGYGAGRTAGLAAPTRTPALAAVYDFDWARAAPATPALRWAEAPNLSKAPVHVGEDGSALQMITAFPPRISHAAILLSAAFADAAVTFRRPPHRPNPPHKATHRWYFTLVDTCLHRAREVRSALVFNWTPSGRAERLWDDAFATLCELSPARHELLVLLSHDRGKASAELVKHLDLAARQFELSATLLADAEASWSEDSEDSEEARRFTELRAALLVRAGGGLSLTEGAALMGVSRQALHKRVKAGGALGLMDGARLVLPRMQWVSRDGKVVVLPGLAEVVKLFDRAGGWSALQFLLDPDPNLGSAPIEALRAGRVDDCVVATRAYLGFDEE